MSSFISFIDINVLVFIVTADIVDIVVIIIVVAANCWRVHTLGKEILGVDAPRCQHILESLDDSLYHVDGYALEVDDHEM